MKKLKVSEVLKSFKNSRQKGKFVALLSTALLFSFRQQNTVLLKYKI